MNIEKERKAFEQLPDIKGILQDGYGFNSELNQYFHPDIENHRLGCAFIMGAWMAYQARAKKLEGCVVVPVELSDEKADSLVSKLFEGFKNIFNSEHRELSATEREKLRLRWSRTKAKTLQEDYKLLVEAARGGNEH